jgi:predicted enzyme related to lactoylglutathione lyase
VHWIEYDIAGQTLALAVNMPNWKPSGDGAGVSLEVEDLEAALATIREAGHEVAMEIGDFPICRIAVIADPDGNGISLHQKKPNHPDLQ